MANNIYMELEFNNEDIKEIVFKGFEDNDEVEFNKFIEQIDQNINKHND